MRTTLLKREAWESELGFYARNLDSIRGPAFNVRLYKIWDETIKLEDHFDFEIDGDPDPGGYLQHDLVRHEFEWFKDWIGPIGQSEPGMLDFAGPLNADRFKLSGRSGGWLVYDLYDRRDDYLDVDEFEALKKLWEKLPSMVEGVAQSIAVELFARARADAQEQRWVSRINGLKDGLVELVDGGSFATAKEVVDEIAELEHKLQGDHFHDFLDEAWEVING